MNLKKQTSSSFERYLIQEYFKHGSITKVFQKHKYSLPISFAGFARVLSKYGVVKSAGPNSKISESLYIMSLLANYKIPLEKIYHEYAPKNLQISTNTLHRIFHYTRLGLTRRQGAILIISPQNNPQKVLVGHDDSLSGDSIRGKKGNLTLPMSHTKTGEPIRDSIARILQNEVFTKSVIRQNFPWHIIPAHIKPIININLTDIHVSVFCLKLPSIHPAFSSYKLSHLKMVDINKIDFSQARPGVEEVLDAYQNRSYAIENEIIPTITSKLNTKIFALAKEAAE